MTPQEHELVTQLFDRLAALEGTPRDPDAELAIIEGLRRSPNAAYALVQTVLVQDEALKRANERITALEARLGNVPAAQPTGFLDSMRDALLGRRETPQGGSVPSVRPARTQDQTAADTRDQATLAGAAPWRQGAAPGGSFLGTAAAAAAGVIGGSLLLDGIRSMMWHGNGAFIADPAFAASRDLGSPWGNGGGDLGRQAGIDDIGRDSGRDSNAGSGDGSGFGLFDNAAADDEADPGDVGGFDDSGGGDLGGGDFGSSDA
jgi:uncharacterized protein